MKMPRTIISRARLLVVAAFTLVEIMVVMALLSIIVLGLMVMFSQTQKAFRAGMTQTDQMEGGRMLSELMLRDLEQIQASGQPTGMNFYTQIPQSYYPLAQSMPAGTVARTNVLQDLFFVTRANQTWSGVGYFVRSNGVGIGVQTFPDIVGTLYRFETNMPVALFNGSNAFQQFLVATNGGIGSVSKIMDGVVEFSVHCYDTNGILMTHISRTNFVNNFNSLLITDSLLGDPNYVPGEERSYAFSNTVVPAYVEVQVGVLEPDVLKRFNSIPDPTVRSNFLASHAGNVQIFRQRIPIRDVDPSTYQ